MHIFRSHTLLTGFIFSKTAFYRISYNSLMLTVVLAVIALLLMLFAVISIILPLLPGGVPVAWLGLFIFAVGTGFERISVVTIIIFLVLTLLILVLNFFIPMIGAGRFKAGRWGMWGAMLGSFFGIFLWGFWGTILGPFFGTTLGEIMGGRRPLTSMKIGLGTVIGIIVGGLLNIIFVLIMLGVLIASWF
jgi:uncharacterized protein